MTLKLVHVNRRVLIVAAFAVGVLAIGLLSRQGEVRGAALTEPACLPDQLLVKFQSTADPATVTARYGATILNRIEGIDVYVLAVPAGSGHATITALQSDPEVMFAEPTALVGIPEEPPPAAEPCDVANGA